MATALENARAQLAAWEAASLAVAGNQEYEINSGTGSRRLKRADAAEIREMVKYWQGQVLARTPGRRRIRYVVPQ